MSIRPQDFQLVAKMVQESSGIWLEQGKEYLVEGRLEPLVQSLGFLRLDALLERLRKSPYGSLRDQVVEALTTNETYFFRDHFPFETLRKEILPKLASQARKERVLNIWSAASSSGQEPYSIAMILLEHFPSLDPSCVRIWASDYSTAMLERSQKGCYNETEIGRGLPLDLLDKYFQRGDDGWTVVPRLRRLVHCMRVNLALPWPDLPKMDVIFLRNVLIYFDARTKKVILERVAANLQPGGYLFLGAAETTLNLSKEFQRSTFDKAGCFQFRPA